MPETTNPETAYADPISPDEFMSAAPKSVAGSSPWAALYAAQIKREIYEHAARAPRTLQQHLGPSEIGVECDRQVAGKFAALPATNHVNDPWPSIVGTWAHAGIAEMFIESNIRNNVLRWVVEQKVTPHPDHPGTADLYDAVEQAVVDHKFLGSSTLAKIRKDPPRKYKVQLLLYGLGYLLLGLPVRRVVIVAYPRTEATLAGLYVWDHEFARFDEAAGGWVITDENRDLLIEVFTDTARRRGQADEFLAQRLAFDQIPAMPDSSECYFCPFYRPHPDEYSIGCTGKGHLLSGP